jgi:hypothetical protein
LAPSVRRKGCFGQASAIRPEATCETTIGRQAPPRGPPVGVTVEVLEKCLDRLAEIINEAGDKGAVYLPIYERLDTELEKLKAKDELMAHIRARAKR